MGKHISCKKSLRIFIFPILILFVFLSATLAFDSSVIKGRAFAEGGPTITFPDSGTTYTTSSPLLTANVTSTVDLAEYGTMKLNGQTVGATFAHSGYWGDDGCGGTTWIEDPMTGTITFQTSNLPDGPYTLEVEAKDINNAVTTMTFNFTVNTNQVSVYFSGYNYSIGEGGTQTITVNLSSVHDAVYTVNYATSDGTAQAGVDYTAASGTLTFASGETSKTFTIDTMDDSVYKGNRTVNLTLSSPTGMVLGSVSNATLTVGDNDPVPVIELSAVGYDINEGGGTAVIMVTRTNTNGVSSVNYTTGNGTAVAGSDFTSTSGTLNFGPGEGAKFINVPIVDDAVYEGNETLTITLSSPTTATLGAASTATINILDNDSPPVVQFSAATYNIGEAGGAFNVTVNLSIAGSTSATVNYGMSNGTAVLGTDYNGTSGSLTFSPGQTQKTFTVTPVNDSVYRGDRTINLTLSSPTGATLGAISSAVITISDNEPAPVIQPAAGTYSVNEGASVDITVNRSISTGTSTVYYTTSDGTAVAGTHYTAVSGTLTFNNGESTKTITVSTAANAGNRNFNFTLSSPGYAVLGAQTSALITTVGILPAFSLQTPTPGSTTVDNTSVSVKVYDAGGIDPTSIVMLIDGLPVSPDFNAGTGVISYTPGTPLADGLRLIEVSAKDMGGLQATTSWNYTIIQPPAITYSGDGSTINNASPLLSVSVTSPIDLAAWGTMTLNGSPVAVTFDYPIGHWEDIDCDSVWVPDDKRVGTISFQTTNLPDGLYNMVVQAQDSLGNITAKQFSFVINTSPVKFSSATYGVNEGDTASITVYRNVYTGGTSTIHYATSNGTATAGTEYTAASGTLTFAPGETSKTFSVQTADDNVYKGPMTIILTLSDVTGASLGTPSGAVLTITENDSVPGVHFSAAAYSIAEGGAVTVTVSLSAGSGVASSVYYSTSDGTATAGADYTPASGTLNFAAWETSKTFTVSTINETVYEPNETINLNLSSPSGLILNTPSSAVISITNDDPKPTVNLSSATYSASEGGTAAVTVDLSAASAFTSTVNYATSNGTAVAGNDYNAVSGTLTFAPGETSKTFSVPTISDAVYEGNETVDIAISSPGGLTLGTQNTAVMTINDDDPLPVIQFAASTSGVVEGSTVNITVYKIGQSALNATVHYATSDNTAIAGTDYTATSGTLTFTPGESSKTISVSTINDTDYEGSKTLNIVLSSPGTATLGTTVSSLLTISDNDTAPGVHFSSAAYTVTEGNSVVVSVSLSGTTYLTASVHYAASNGTAIVDRDTRPISGILTFAPGETSKTFTVNTVDDAVYEGNETLVLSLSQPADAELGMPNTAVLTIVDNDPVSTAFYNPHGNYKPGTDACVKCHITHQATGVGSLFYLVTEKLTCYICHNGAAANGNIKAELGENVVGTSVYSSYHPVVNGPQLCTSCHNPHAGPAAKPALLEVGASKVSSGNAVCAQCHGAGTAIDGGDITTTFTGTAHDTAMTNPTSGTQIKCIRCHQPHGSPNKPLLQSKIVDDSNVSHNVYGNDNSLCFACHSNALRSFPGSTVYNATYHGTKSTSTVAAVTYSGIEYTATPYTGTLCLNCHDPHGKTGVANYRRAAGNDLCYKCHDADGISLTATYSYRGRTEYEQGVHAAARATGLSTLTSGSSGFLAWESASEPTPSSPGTVMSNGKISNMTSNDAYWATTSLATSGQTDYQMYRFKQSISTLLLRGMTATWTGSGETAVAAPYTRPITITGSTSGALTNYQVAVTVDTASLVTAGKMRSDGADIRFTNSSGVQLPYWIESGMNTNATKIWVKVDSIPDGKVGSPNNQTTIYLNYGDPNLTVGASDIKSTMLYYDDFSTVDPGWTNANITGGVLKIGGGVNNGASHPLTGASPSQIYIEYDYAFGPGNGTTQAGSNFFGNNYIRPHRVYGDLFTNTDFGEPYVTGITWNETSHKIKLWWWGGGANQFKIGCDSSVATGTLSTSGNVNNISFYLDSATWGPSVIDNLLIRKYTMPEPVVSAPGAEAGSLPTSVYIWNNTLNTGSGGWELLRSGPMYSDTTVTTQKTNPTDYINGQGYVYMMAKSQISTGSLSTNYVSLGLTSLSESSAGLCDNCHAPHGKTDSNGNLYPKQLQATPNTVCFGGNIGCHSDSINSQHSINLLERFTASANPLAHHSVDPTEQQANGSKVDCKNCHNPHVSSGIIDPYYPTTPFPVNYTSSDIGTYIGSGGEVYLMTSSKHDGAVPVITSGPTVSNMSATECTVTWTTDQATNGFIEYGTTSGYGTEQVSINADPAPYIHTVRLTDLVPGQNYHFQVRSYDPVGNYKFSDDAKLDDSVPTITSGPTADLVGDSTTIYWNTDEPSTTVVHYGPSDVESYVYTSSNSNYSTTHSVTIPTPAGSNYHFQIQSVDYRGNTVTGNDTLINNSTTPPSVPVLIDPAPLPTGQNTVNLTLNWNSSTDPNNYTPILYTAQLSRLPDFSTITQTVQNQAGTSWNLSITDDYGLTPVTWYWRVRARNSEGADSAWASSSFTHTPAASPSACPNLYVWNGSKYVFVTDLAASSVGQQDGVNKNKFAEVFPDLNVAIPWNLLQEKDGKYSIKIKSERDEIDFIDSVDLMAVDHPIGTKVALNDLMRGSQPNEIYAYSENLRPVKRGRYGDDNQFTFDLGNLSKAKYIKLVMNGWTELTNRAENAIAENKLKNGTKISPTFYEILQPDGTWKKRPLSEFSGLPKTVVLDLTGQFPKGTKKYVVRLRGMMRARIDYVGIDTSPYAKYTVRELEMLNADLGYRGVSLPNGRAKTFDYDKLVKDVIWHAGRFTKYGDVMPLVTQVDDKPVVMDSGDELSLTFKALPAPVPGMTRSFVLKPWDYYKEYELATVEPIPFRGMDMSKLPDSLGEYPAGHDAYVAEWNTRIHHAGPPPAPGFFDGLVEKLKQMTSYSIAAMVKLWHGILGENDISALPYNETDPAWLHAPSYAKHYSLNTNYINLQVDNLVNTVVYNAYSPSLDLWQASSDMLTPTSPTSFTTSGYHALSDNISNIAASDDSSWRTDYFAAPNTGDGKYNYQMIKFVINRMAPKIYSLKIGWQGWGEPSPGYPTTLNIWNFAQSRWDQIYSGVVGANTGAGTEKYVSFEPFCYKCHAGTRPSGVQLGTVPSNLQQGASNKNIQSTFTSDIHGGGSGPQTDSGYANDYTSWSFAGPVSGGTIGGAYARANAALPCNDCHDTHGSNSVYHFREHINGDINQDLTNYPNGNKVPTAEYADNANMLHFCQSCHVGTLRQFHGACLDCHIAGDNYEHTPAPTADDFGRACVSCHYHGATYPAHGACHCYLNNPVKAF